MIKHIVCMKFRDRGVAMSVAEKLNGLPEKIPVINSLETGIDFLHSERSCDLVLITTFPEKGDLDLYQKHPAHMEVQEYIKSVRESSVSVDFEF